MRLIQIWDALSLRMRLALSMSLLLALVALVMVELLPARLERLAQRWLEQRAESMALLLADHVAPGLDFNDSDTVGRQLQGLERAADVRYALVRGPGGVRVASWTSPDAKATPVVPPDLAPDGATPATRFADGMLWAVASVDRGDAALGTVALAYSVEHTEEAIRSNAATVTLVALGVFVLGTLVSWVLGSVLARPIRHLADAALRIAEGDLVTAERILGGREEGLRLAQEGAARPGDRSEVRHLGTSFARMLQSVRETTVTLQESAQRLTAAVVNLNSSSTEQTETISRQASALQETQVTAQEIRQTSLLAAQKAENVLHVAVRAEELGRNGERSIEDSLSGMGGILSQVTEIAQRIQQLGDRSRQIGQIANTVKELADRSNMLALNAAIEAARSGEHGKGFAVVAREIRSLADQSIQATNRVNEIVQDIFEATRSTVSLTEQGAVHIEGGLGQVRASGESLKELSGIVQDNASAVKQIAVAVNQQNAGIGQIFTAVEHLSGMMDETMRRLESTGMAMQTVHEVSEKVASAAQRFRV